MRRALLPFRGLTSHVPAICRPVRLTPEPSTGGPTDHATQGGKPEFGPEEQPKNEDRHPGEDVPSHAELYRRRVKTTRFCVPSLIHGSGRAVPIPAVHPSVRFTPNRPATNGRDRARQSSKPQFCPEKETSSEYPNCSDDLSTYGPRFGQCVRIVSRHVLMLPALGVTRTTPASFHDTPKRHVI